MSHRTQCPSRTLLKGHLPRQVSLRPHVRRRGQPHGRFEVSRRSGHIPAVVTAPVATGDGGDRDRPVRRLAGAAPAVPARPPAAAVVYPGQVADVAGSRVRPRQAGPAPLLRAARRPQDRPPGAAIPDMACPAVRSLAGIRRICRPGTGMALPAPRVHPSRAAAPGDRPSAEREISGGGGVDHRRSGPGCGDQHPRRPDRRLSGPAAAGRPRARVQSRSCRELRVHAHAGTLSPAARTCRPRRAVPGTSSRASPPAA